MFRTMGERTKVRSQRRAAKRRFPSMVVGDVGPGNLRAQPMRPLETTRLPNANSRASGRITQLRFDVLLVLTVITLLVFGLIMVYSASYDYSLLWYDDPMEMFQRQLLWLALGLAALITLANIDYHQWRDWAVPLIVVTGLALLYVLVQGNLLNGAKRTIFGGSVQPSELTKVAVVIYLSVWLYSKRDQLGQVTYGLVPLAIILGFLGGLIFLEPDLSATLSILMLGGLMFFLAGGDLRQIAVILLVAMVVGFLMVNFTPTGKARLDDYLRGFNDPTQSSSHVFRSYGAFAKGGWFGVGIGKAEAKVTGLPVPPTDSIFAVIGEETGIVGVVFLVLLYSGLLWRGLTIARRAPDQMGALLAGGLTFWIVIEALINMASMISLIPFTGNALPFISAGGSSLVMSMASIGIILNVSRLSEKKKEDHGKYFNAVIDLRRRDRGRGISGDGGAPGVAQPRTRARQ
ncbi:MAG: putative peptidoglycan glycosyltransferase FtsW [Anaerolineales bacterium]|nr:putative peptidoglycan glycosyltransferase FtsW [Anaerolineales bacterium]